MVLARLRLRLVPRGAIKEQEVEVAGVTHEMGGRLVDGIVTVSGPSFASMRIIPVGGFSLD
jgi:hypothetical protein